MWGDMSLWNVQGALLQSGDHIVPRILTVDYTFNMSRQFFNTLVVMGTRSHDFDDELKISFLISSSDARSKTFILDLIFFFALVEYSVLYLEIWNGCFQFYPQNTQRNDHKVILLMLILAEQEVKFYAECYLLNFIGDGDCPNFLK